MRYVYSSAIAVVCLSGALRGDTPAPSYNQTDTAIVTMGDKIAGRIGACLMGQSKKPKICFGLTKEIDGDPQFTFVVLFRTGKRNLEPTGVEGDITSDGATTKIKNVYSLGEVKLPLTLETKRDANTNKITESKAVVGDFEISTRQPAVVIVDLTGEKPVYKRVKVQLPACKVDLADKEQKSWPKAIDDAIAELKEKSKEIKNLAD